jgi:hypothetical protein
MHLKLNLLLLNCALRSRGWIRHRQNVIEVTRSLREIRSVRRDGIVVKTRRHHSRSDLTVNSVNVSLNAIFGKVRKFHFSLAAYLLNRHMHVYALHAILTIDMQPLLNFPQLQRIRTVFSTLLRHKGHCSTPSLQSKQIQTWRHW